NLVTINTLSSIYKYRNALSLFFFFFFFNNPAPTEIYTLSLHDALPISRSRLLGLSEATCASRRSRAAPAPPSSCAVSRRRSIRRDRKSTRLNSSHDQISYAVFCLKKKS